MAQVSIDFVQVACVLIEVQLYGLELVLFQGM